ncbi:MAG: hypothetical protein K8R02_03390, partial [Anaerohalosphaeraceae bacterium]|nr:hypothetical protein [Anaerohalosphaeraceae bacterium]
KNIPAAYAARLLCDGERDKKMRVKKTFRPLTRLGFYAMGKGIRKCVSKKHSGRLRGSASMRWGKG